MIFLGTRSARCGGGVEELWAQKCTTVTLSTHPPGHPPYIRRWWSKQDAARTVTLSLAWLDPRSGPHATLLRYGVDEIGEDDYYVRSAEFKAWLADTSASTSTRSRAAKHARYFERFIRRWNDGRLPDDYYKGTIT